jgi:hypothetical protein
VSTSRGATSRTRARTGEPEETERERRDEPALSQAQMLLALQRTAGNQAVAGALQRKVKLGTKPWLKANAALPAISPAIKDRYEPYVVDQVETLARQWRDDAVATPARAFATADLFYQAVFDHVLTQGKAGVASDANRWAKLKAGVKTAGNVTEVPWANFGAVEGPLLDTDLSACGVQISGNTGTTACHGNTHHKLPKKVNVPGGQELSSLLPSQQPAHTDYIEFLVPGHKNETGIERAILDRATGQIYITAHYTVGSFVWLSGAPGGLVANWQAKALTYVNSL